MSESGLLSFREKLTSSQAGIPVDKLLTRLVGQLSRRQIRRELDAGNVTLNGVRVRRASFVAKAGDILELSCPDPDILTTGALPVSSLEPSAILLRQGKAICINKPPGLLSQPTRNPKAPHAVLLLKDLLDTNRSSNAQEPVLCHRLDRETSGVLLLASDHTGARFFMDQFRKRKTKKKYLALCHGIPTQKEWQITGFLSPIDKKSGDVRVVRSGGKKAITGFRLLEQFPECSMCLIACFPETGRGHQIRVHLDFCGHPILGDKRYGRAANRDLPLPLIRPVAAHHMLHAQKLGFFPEASGPMVWAEAPLPATFASILDFLRQSDCH